MFQQFNAPTLQYSNTPFSRRDISRPRQTTQAQFGDALSEPAEFRGEITIQLADAERIVEVCEFAKKELGFDFSWTSAASITTAKTPAGRSFYHLRRLADSCELRIKTSVSEEQSELPTIIGVWRTADCTSAKSTT